MGNTQHALLSASSANKWLNCTPSALLELEFENKTSGFMAEGTLAHSIAETKLNAYFWGGLNKKQLDAKLNSFKKDSNFDSEMLEHTDTYLDYVKTIALQYSCAPLINIEKRLDYSEFVKEGFGTADCIIIAGDTLHIIDFKYGKGVMVSAENNSQMKLYALGAISNYSLFYNINKVIMSIVQPRLTNISVCEITTEQLIDWGYNVVKPQAEKAFKGEGDFKPGDHCKFCRAKAVCKARADNNYKAIQNRPQNKALLNSTEISKLLLDTLDVADWLKDLQLHALNSILDGDFIPGWKVVEGKSNRVISDIDSLFDILEKNDFDKEMLYERNPLGLTALEKLVGKKKLEGLASSYIIKPKGRPTLVLESDKRDTYQSGTTAKNDFADNL